MSQTRRVRIVAAFHPADVERHGLAVGAEVEVLPVEGDPRLWVRCPEIGRKTSRGFRMVSDGYCTLEPNEYEEL